MKTIQWSIFIIYAVVSCCMIASQQALSDELNSTRKTVYQKRLNEQGHPNSFVRKPFDPRKLPRVELPDIPQTNSNGKKYLSPSNSGVSETWSSRYDTKVTSTYAWAYRNGLDSTGNVYVIGSVEQNLLIVKYNTDGTKLWEALYRPENISSPFNFDINDAVVDRGGNIYVTFFLSYDDIESYDVLTTKFNSNGTKIWEQRYQHIGELNQSFVAYDRGGNCYITFSYYLQYAQSGVSNIFTIKYDVSGFQKWMREFNGPANTEDEPGGISTDDSGNVFIAGYSGDYGMILKYDSLGNQQWVKYNNSGDGRIVLDNAGNMYVGGRFVSKYNSAGIRLWKSSYSSWAIALDNGGNLILYQDSLVKLNGATGNVLWTRPYGTPYSNRVTIDAFNNIYLCENIYTDTTRADMQIRKISSGGTLNWTNTYRSPNDDYFADITLDTNGDVYVTGTTYQSNYSMLTIKYSSDGDSLWGDRYSSTNNYSLTDRPSYLAVDSSGNVYVAGTYGGQWSSRQGMTTIKYNSAGDSLWRRNYEFEYYPGNARTSATSLAVDGNGNVYVTGYSYRGWNSEYYDYLTIKYNSNGDTLWTRTYNGTSNYYDYPVAIALDNLGNAYVTGYSYQQNSYSNDVVTIKYNPAGDTLWVRAFNGGDYYADYPTALTLDHSGNICITGYSRSNINDDASSNFITVKYSPTG
ncbi:MAG: SBBP repeat-containing protein, partial [Ignavibacteriales bacterium]|nr:SBBP repeat-containing protein [Ignavibacteriales bacterium]